MGTGSSTAHQSYTVAPTTDADTDTDTTTASDDAPPTFVLTDLAALQQLSTEQLQELAAAQGFKHPELVGLSGKKPHPLVHWLDPAYPETSPSKLKIQAVAEDRYQQLVASGAMEPDPPDVDDPDDLDEGAWEASLADIVGVQADLATEVAAYAALKKPGPPAGPELGNAELAAMIAAENRLALAVCPEDLTALAKAQAAAKLSVDQAIAGGPWLTRFNVVDSREQAVADGLLTAAQAGVLSPGELLAVARLNGNVTTAAENIIAADARVAQSAVSADLKQQLAEFGATPVVHWKYVDAAQLGQLAVLLEKNAKIDSDRHVWGPQACDPVKPPYVNATEMSTKFRAWAKTQPITVLREAAGHAGLQAADHATRAELQNYLASHWDKNLHKNGIQEQVNAKKNPPPPPAAPPAPAAAAKTTATTAPPSGPATPIAAPPAAASPKGTSGPGGGWAAQQRGLVDALQHAASAKAAVPAHLDSTAVAGWDFGPGTNAAHLGGTHPKSLHTGPDGGTWMFKHDAAGVGSAAEADASRLFAAAGVPAVPVYRASIAGKTGSVQPLLKGATTLPAQPGQWSQTDVDSILRYHVAAWAVGNHDGHAANMLRVPGGGIVACDLGQAFKQCHQDKLGLGFSPSTVTVHGQLYQAHLTGGLAPGVKVNPAVLAPVLASIDKIPATQWRAMLHDTAHAGVNSGAPWVPAMRARAAAAHGIDVSAVTAAQTAGAFLDAAVDRKQGLRAAFAGFFGKELKLPSASLLHGGH